MEIEEMKVNWQSARHSITPGSGAVPDDSRKTYLQRLSHKYTRIRIFSLIFMILGPMILYNEGVTSVWLLASYAILLGVGSIVDHYLSLSIRAIDPSLMSVTEVMRRILNCRKIHLRWVVIVLPIVIFWCAALAYVMQANIYFVYGICAGGIVGLVIGVHVLLRFLHDYRAALRE